MSLPPSPPAVTSHARAGAWSGPTGALALVVVVGATIWRATILGRGWFARHDFLLMAPDASVTDTTGPGGFAPGAVLLGRVLADLAPLSWPVAAAAVVAISSAALVLAWWVLSALLPGRWIRLPLLVLLATTPLTLWSTQSWTVALQFWPGTVGSLLACLGVVHLADAQRPRPALPLLAVGAGLLLALVSDERWVVAPLLLLGLGVAVSPGGSLAERLRNLARRSPAPWAVVVLVTGTYVVVRALAVPVGDGVPSGALVTASLRHLAVLLPGGPWRSGTVGHASLAPADLAVGAGMLVVLALAAFTLRRGASGARVAAVTLVVVLGALAVVPPMLRDAGPEPTADLVHRFGAVASVVLTVLLAAAWREIPPFTVRRPVRGAARGGRDVGEPAASAAVALALTASAALSTPALAAPTLHEEARRYVEQVRAGLRADPTVVLLDSGAPEAVLGPSGGSAARVSTVLARADEVPAFDIPSHRLRTVTATGALVPVPLAAPVPMAPGDDPACPWPVGPSGAVVPLRGPVPAGRLVARVGYYTGSAGLVSMDVAGRRVDVPVRSGLNAVDVVVEGPFDRIALRLEGVSGTVCVASLDVGRPVVATP